MNNLFNFPESNKAHEWLDPLALTGIGIEIGSSAHNSYGITNCINLDYTDSLDTIYKQEEIRLCGRAAKVDVVAFAHEIPFPDSHFSFLLNSHVFEHQCNPIRTLKEWHRVVRKDGIVLSVVPKHNALASDECLEITTVNHQVWDYINNETYETHVVPDGSGKYGHYHIYTIESYLELISYINSMFGNLFEIVDSLETDDKVRNGFLVVHRVIK